MEVVTKENKVTINEHESRNLTEKNVDHSIMVSKKFSKGWKPCLLCFVLLLLILVEIEIEQLTIILYLFLVSVVGNAAPSSNQVKGSSEGSNID